jgi:murein DD-endopeptidase MepM/ murein hydrolase activator NlpD
MKPKSINKWLICLIVLFFVQLACQYNVPPTLPRIQQPIFDFFHGFINFGKSLGLLPGFHPAPMILEVTHPDSNMMSPTITGRINSGVSNLSILRLYTLKLMGCDKGYVKNNLVSEYDVKDILIGPDKFEWVIENAPIDEGAIFGVTLVGLSYDKSAVIETGMSNIWMNQTQKIELYVDPVETITRSGVISVSGKADIENLCLTLSRNGLSENETAVTSHGNWLFENVNITPGRNEFIIAAKQNYLGDVSNKTIVIDGFEIKMDWPFGKIENGVYKPAYQQGRLTSWYGWNHYHVRKGYGLHNGIDIAPHGMTDLQVRAVADGVIYLKKYLTCEGNSVGIDHGGWGTFYIHLRSINPNVKTGVEVKAGDPLGIIGNTGSCSDGVHLHFAAFTWKNGALNKSNCQNIFCGEPYQYININPFSESVPINTNNEPYDLKTCTPNFDVWRFNWRKEGVQIDSAYFELRIPPMHPSKDKDPCQK